MLYLLSLESRHTQNERIIAEYYYETYYAF